MDEYLVEWLEDHKRNITTRTYEGYKSYIDQRIVPYFREKHILVKDMTGDNINAFYRYLTEQGLKGTSQQRYHSVLHLAFKTAVKRRIIPANPVDQADRPKSKPFIASYYNADEMKKLLEIAEKDELHLVILLTAYYGLRRSEVLGLKWSAIDFTDKKIAIRHKVLEESGEIHGYDVMKTKSSYRTLPLIPVVEEALRNQISFRDEMKKAFRKGYCTDYEEYICTDALGRLYRPDYVSEHFALLLKNNGLRHIRFHELRHDLLSTTEKVRFSLPVITTAIRNTGLLRFLSTVRLSAERLKRKSNRTRNISLSRRNGSQATVFFSAPKVIR